MPSFFERLPEGPNGRAGPRDLIPSYLVEPKIVPYKKFLAESMPDLIRFSCTSKANRAAIIGFKAGNFVHTLDLVTPSGTKRRVCLPFDHPFWQKAASELSRLQKIRVGHLSLVGEKGMRLSEKLGLFPSVRTLELNRLTAMDGIAGIVPLTPLAKIQEVEISGTHILVSTPVLLAVAQQISQDLPELKRLHASKHSLPIAVISQMQQLQELSLTLEQAEDAITQLTHHTSLRTLSLHQQQYESGIFGTLFTQIRQIPSITEVLLAISYSSHSFDLEEIAARLGPRITLRVIEWECSSIDNIIQNIDRLGAVKTLHLKTMMTQEQFHLLRELPSLCEIKVYTWDTVYKQDLADAFPHIAVIDCYYSNQEHRLITSRPPPPSIISQSVSWVSDLFSFIKNVFAWLWNAFFG